MPTTWPFRKLGMSRANLGTQAAAEANTRRNRGISQLAEAYEKGGAQTDQPEDADAVIDAPADYDLLQKVRPTGGGFKSAFNRKRR